MKILMLSGNNKILPIDPATGKVKVEKDYGTAAKQACEVFVAHQSEFSCKRAIKALQELEKANGW